jgi:hypothetical protein
VCVCVCVFIAAVPMTKLFAWLSFVLGEGKKGNKQGARYKDNMWLPFVLEE